MLVPTICAVLGLLLWIVSSHPKISEAGRLMFAVGLLVLVAEMAGRSIHLPV